MSNRKSDNVLVGYPKYAFNILEMFAYYLSKPKGFSITSTFGSFFTLYCHLVLSLISGFAVSNFSF